jgi:predicted hotdog family 3-hydroxylacyl-ACP dehydratase
MQMPEVWPKNAGDYIPHSGLMRLVDELLSSGDGKAEVTAIIRDGNPFLRADGTLEEAVFVEMIAQAIAAGNGHDLTEEQRRTRTGYLLGAKSLKITGTARVGDILLIKARKNAEFGDFGIIEGQIFCGGELIAAGEIKVFQTFDQKPESVLS